jgi:hypothetical protein
VGANDAEARSSKSAMMYKYKKFVHLRPRQKTGGPIVPNLHPVQQVSLHERYHNTQ